MPVSVSATLAANEALARRRRAGLRVLPLAFGEAGLPVHPVLGRKLAEAADRNAYGPVAGSQRLRAAAAGYWERRGLATDPGSVICGPGSKPLLYGLLVALDGDVAVPRPSWVSYAAQAHLTGSTPVFVATPPGEGGVPEPDALARAVRATQAGGRRIRAVVLTLPDNPTGTLAHPQTVRRVCEIAREHDLVLISDEIYRDLVFDPATPYRSPAEFAPERTVVTTALSKSLALGGWRIGVARLPDSDLGRRLYRRLLGVVSEIWSSPSGPIQEAAAYAFDEPPELVARIADSRRLHAAVARAAAARFAAVGAEVAAPQAAFYLYPDFEPRRAHLFDAYGITTGADLARHLLDQYGVGVLAGGDFGDPAAALRLRVATSLLYGDTSQQREDALRAGDPLALPWIRAALDRLEEVLAALVDPHAAPGAA